MTITAKIICDSVGPNQVRLTTFVLSYPRFIHSEMMTHRMFSRNASSSRAIPFEKQVDMILADPAMPLEFRLNQKGMQAGAALEEEDQSKARATWRIASYKAIELAKELAALGVHKQYVNRILEPFAHISVVLTATEYSNFFALRHHSMAQPEIAELAKQMWEAYKANTPKNLNAGSWHLPFITNEEIIEVAEQAGVVYDDYDKEDANAMYNDLWHPLIKTSVARCARVSYNNHDGTKSSYEQDCILYDRLLGAQPIHASPAEHQAQALSKQYEYDRDTGSYPQTSNEWSGNLKGWIQYRKTLEGENITTFEGPLG